MRMFYYCRDGQAVEGPVSIDELAKLKAEGQVTSETSVAVAGEETWSPLDSFLPHRKPVPPPLPVAPPTVPKHSATARIWSKFIVWFRPLEFRHKVIVIGGAILVFALIFGSGSGTSERYHDDEGISAAESDELVRGMEASAPTVQHTCSACRGSGETIIQSYLSQECGTCSSRGTIRTRSGYDTTCPACGGLGSQKPKPERGDCSKCGGSGYVWGY